MKSTIRAALLAFALSALALSASAQPIHDGVPLGMLRAAQSQLNLNTSQQQLWDNAVTASSAVRDAMRAAHEQGHAALQAELAKAEPDFASLAAAQDASRAQLASVARQARDAWLALYATFTPEQKGITRDAIKTKLENAQARRAARAHGSASTN